MKIAKNKKQTKKIWVVLLGITILITTLQLVGKVDAWVTWLIVCGVITLVNILNKEKIQFKTFGMVAAFMMISKMVYSIFGKFYYIPLIGFLIYWIIRSVKNQALQDAADNLIVAFKNVKVRDLTDEELKKKR